MASSRNLWTCLECGEYISGSSSIIMEQCEQHMCQNESKRANFEKIRKMLADEMKKIPETSSNMSEQLVTSLASTEATVCTFVKSIKTDFHHNQIYFFVGKVLIALNPYRKIDTLYSQETMRKYQSEANLPAHLYSIVNEALNGIQLDERSQSIIILGETGAGKTETTKQIVNYLCNSGQLVQKLRNASPILDAFGNAKTEQNHNSSRYCKFFEIYYNLNHEIVGGHLKNFMLEKSRIYSNEGCYHIFRILQNAPENIKTSLGLNNALFDTETQSASLESVEFDQSLDKLGFDECKKTRLYRLIAGIFCLSQVKFESKQDDDGCSISSASNSSLMHAAKFLSLDQNQLITALISRTIRTSGENEEVIVLPMNKIFAEAAKNTLAKTIYIHLHHWVVQQINECIKPTDQNDLSHIIGILDMPGFECFKNNSYEQLLINFVNESIQKFSIEHLMKNDVPNKPKNKHEAVADLIGNDQNGIITLLDDECKLLVPTANNLTNNIIKTWGSSPVLVNKIHSNPYTCFTVQHFACDVTYSAADFIEKNTTSISEDITRISKSILKCLGDLNIFPDKTTKRVGISEGSTTKAELKTLLSTLQQTSLNFIRCIKPNAYCQSNRFDEAYIATQMENTGTSFLIENVSVVKKIGEDRILDVDRKLSCNEEPRYDKYNHFAVFDMSMKSGSRCKVCKKTTFLKCGKCKLSLCLLRDRNCFLSYHEK